MTYGIILPRTQSPERDVRQYCPSGRFSFAWYNNAFDKKYVKRRHFLHLVRMRQWDVHQYYSSEGFHVRLVNSSF